MKNNFRFFFIFIAAFFFPRLKWFTVAWAANVSRSPTANSWAWTVPALKTAWPAWANWAWSPYRAASRSSSDLDCYACCLCSWDCRQRTNGAVASRWVARWLEAVAARAAAATAAAWAWSRERDFAAWWWTARIAPFLFLFCTNSGLFSSQMWGLWFFFSSLFFCCFAYFRMLSRLF